MFGNAEGCVTDFAGGGESRAASLAFVTPVTLILIVFGLVLFAIPVVATISAATTPTAVFEAADQSKPLWIALSLLTWLGAPIYLMVIRPRLLVVAGRYRKPMSPTTSKILTALSGEQADKKADRLAATAFYFIGLPLLLIGLTDDSWALFGVGVTSILVFMALPLMGSDKALN